ncbi:hypothetical protein [Castellaniella caeni]|nr:hypothetical protein [Castellaniella caeni]
MSSSSRNAQGIDPAALRTAALRMTRAASPMAQGRRAGPRIVAAP